MPKILRHLDWSKRGGLAGTYKSGRVGETDVDKNVLAELMAQIEVLKIKRRGEFACEYDDKGLSDQDVLYELAQNEIRCVVCGYALVSNVGLWPRRGPGPPLAYTILKCPCSTWMHYICLGKLWKEEKKGWLSRELFVACPRCGHKFYKTGDSSNKRDPFFFVEELAGRKMISHYPTKHDRGIEMDPERFREFRTALKVSEKAVTVLLEKISADDITMKQFKALKEQVTKEIDLMKVDIYRLHVKKAQMKGLKCNKCGASLPKLEEGQETFFCEYCSTPYVLSWE